MFTRVFADPILLTEHDIARLETIDNRPSHVLLVVLAVAVMAAIGYATRNGFWQ